MNSAGPDVATEMNEPVFETDSLIELSYLMAIGFEINLQVVDEGTRQVVGNTTPAVAAAKAITDFRAGAQLPALAVLTASKIVHQRVKALRRGW